MQHYYAVAEPDEEGGFWISFPGRDGIASAASSAVAIVVVVPFEAVTTAKAA